MKVCAKEAYKFSTNKITVTIPLDKIGFIKNGTVNDIVNDTVNGTVNDVVLSKSEKLIIDVISLDANITRKAMCEQTNLSLRTVVRTLDSLKNKGLIL